MKREDLKFILGISIALNIIFFIFVALIINEAGIKYENDIYCANQVCGNASYYLYDDTSGNCYCYDNTQLITSVVGVR